MLLQCLQRIVIWMFCVIARLLHLQNMLAFRTMVILVTSH